MEIAKALQNTDKMRDIGVFFQGALEGKYPMPYKPGNMNQYDILSTYFQPEQGPGIAPRYKEEGMTYLLNCFRLHQVIEDQLAMRSSLNTAQTTIQIIVIAMCVFGVVTYNMMPPRDVTDSVWQALGASYQRVDAHYMDMQQLDQCIRSDNADAMEILDGLENVTKFHDNSFSVVKDHYSKHRMLAPPGQQYLSDPQSVIQHVRTRAQAVDLLAPYVAAGHYKMTGLHQVTWKLAVSANRSNELRMKMLKDMENMTKQSMLLEAQISEMRQNLSARDEEIRILKKQREEDRARLDKEIRDRKRQRKNEAFQSGLILTGISSATSMAIGNIAGFSPAYQGGIMLGIIVVGYIGTSVNVVLEGVGNDIDELTYKAEDGAEYVAKVLYRAIMYPFFG